MSGFVLAIMIFALVFFLGYCAGKVSEINNNLKHSEELLATVYKMDSRANDILDSLGYLKKDVYDTDRLTEEILKMLREKKVSDNE